MYVCEIRHTTWGGRGTLDADGLVPVSNVFGGKWGTPFMGFWVVTVVILGALGMI